MLLPNEDSIPKEDDGDKKAYEFFYKKNTDGTVVVTDDENTPCQNKSSKSDPSDENSGFTAEQNYYKLKTTLYNSLISYFKKFKQIDEENADNLKKTETLFEEILESIKEKTLIKTNTDKFSDENKAFYQKMITVATDISKEDIDDDGESKYFNTSFFTNEREKRLKMIKCSWAPTYMQWLIPELQKDDWKTDCKKYNDIKDPGNKDTNQKLNTKTTTVWNTDNSDPKNPSDDTLYDQYKANNDL